MDHLREMMQTAVYTTEWSRARGETNTAPSEHAHDEMSVPTAIPFRRDEAAPVGVMSPRDQARPNDLSRGVLPVTSTWAIVVSAALIIGFMYQINGKIDRVEVLLAATEKHNKEIQTLLEQKVELQIQLAGMRTTAMQLTQRIEQLQTDAKGRR